MTRPPKPRKWVRASHATLLSSALALAGCAQNGLGSLTELPPPPGAIVDRSLPISVADLPQAAALRTAPRLALVVGNSAYRAKPLRLPGKDAEAIAQALAQRGFELIGGSAQLDVSSRRLRQLIDETEQRVQANPGAIVVVYFAGHGFVDQGHNYLVPVDVADPSQMVSASLGVISTAQRLHAAGSGLTVMLLDACRSYTGSAGGGLTDENAPDNTFIGFAAQFGAVALEPDNGIHGHYTSALLQNLDLGFGRFDDFHLAVSQTVVRMTAADQVPVFRQSEEMPATPIRVASNDPQTAFALARRRHASGSDLAAARCAAEADLKILLSVPEIGNMFAGKAMTIGPLYEPVDLRTTERACASAYAGGHRDPITLRGLAFARIALSISGAQPFKPGDAVENIALLTQAAESGDALSNLLLAQAAAESKFGLVPNEAKDRLIAAAKSNEAPTTGYIGRMLWSPDGADFRREFLLPQDDLLGVRLFRNAVVDGDPFAVIVASAMRHKNKNNPLVADISMRAAYEKAFINKSNYGIYIQGTSLRETLYLFAILQAMDDKDYPEFVRLVTIAAPFLDRAFHNMGAPSTGRIRDAGAFFVAAGYMLGTGIEWNSDTPISGITTNAKTGCTLYQRAAADGVVFKDAIIQGIEHGDCKFSKPQVSGASN